MDTRDCCRKEALAERRLILVEGDYHLVLLQMLFRNKGDNEEGSDGC